MTGLGCLVAARSPPHVATAAAERLRRAAAAAAKAVPASVTTLLADDAPPPRKTGADVPGFKIPGAAAAAKRVWGAGALQFTPAYMTVGGSCVGEAAQAAVAGW